jgi:hypothetical protein
MMLTDEGPYDFIPSTRLGSYWNLVFPYFFSSWAVYAPNSPRYNATLRFLARHGARLLGMLRTEYGGANNVYSDRAREAQGIINPDYLTLALYSQLAHGFTRNTFTTGETFNVGPLSSVWCGPVQNRSENGTCVPNNWDPNEYYRWAYLSPNSANNGAWLGLLRMLLIHEADYDKVGAPTSLYLAFATPFEWLQSTTGINVQSAPTLFGPLSYSMIKVSSALYQSNITLQLTNLAPLTRWAIRFRTQSAITSVLLNGKNYSNWDKSSNTISLPTSITKLQLIVTT